ncbi:Zn-dependent oxidoreductase [Bifidobacterium aemilianum]|uniref:Zn-dependent oxidoreductase n=1 Tax=Bifidobacterium aemilianum TaxID=2493120 RepID=A0A366KCX5_9BIFI|nr:zinc-binding dehydrogenase [Bifidobacterium aemilianum]RBP98521.1 Zn-dependent oxidoreductase [Bifidobacterium aemilianum]
MKSIYACGVNAQDPLSVLAVGEQPEPAKREFWSTLRVKAASVNHHDLWSLAGVGLSQEATPMILGTDAAGTLLEDVVGYGGHTLGAGSAVVPYTVVGADLAGLPAGEGRSILSEHYPGTMAALTSVPSAHILPMPANLSYAEASVLGTSWLTAYSMLFSAAGLKPGDSVLIQGAGGGLSTAALQLGHAAGLEVFVSSRSKAKRERAMGLGASSSVASGARLPHKVDAVIESVGAATWSHSVKAVRPGGTIAICGATSGDQPGAELTRIFFQDIRVVGNTMGSIEDFARLLRLVELADIHPVIDATYPFEEAFQAFSRLDSGDVFGKVVLTFGQE